MKNCLLIISILLANMVLAQNDNIKYKNVNNSNSLIAVDSNIVEKFESRTDKGSLPPPPIVDIKKSFIKSHTPVNGTKTNTSPIGSTINYNAWNVNVVYFDGFGRKIQFIDVKASPRGDDMIKFLQYDTYGRRSKSFLPYSYDQYTPGTFVYNAERYQSMFYDNLYNEGDFAFESYKYDDSPLSKIEMIIPAGEEWNETNHSVKSILTTTNQSTDEVRKYFLVGDDLYVNGNYGGNSLQKIVNTDEDGNQVYNYYNIEGVLILKRNIDGNGKYNTYFVYDDLGRLRYELSPKCSDALKNSNGKIGNYSDNNHLKKTSNYYEYNENGDLIIHQTAGQSPKFYVYNKRNMLVASQDGNQRLDKKWSFIKYDKNNRQIQTGIFNTDYIFSQASMQFQFSLPTYAYEIVDLNNEHGYTDRTLPSIAKNPEFYTNTYYDNYHYIDNLTYATRYEFDDNPEANFFEELASTKTKGYITATKTKVLEHHGNSAVIEWLHSVSYFDKYGNLIQNLVDNQLNGLDITSYKVSFTGEILATHEKHTVSSSNNIIKQSFDYDHNGRLTTVRHKFNSQNEVVLVNHDYDERGQLNKKELHGTTQGNYVQTIDYTYNVKGWIKGINDINSLNDDLFAMEFKYEDGDGPSYNGNISGVSWRSETFTDIKSYSYSYDGLNRLISATFSDNNKFDTNYEYDKNGNIISLHRNGLHYGNQYGVIDDLDYSYDGNQLRTLNDIQGGYQQSNGFKDNGYWGKTEYYYDANGNMIQDKNKQIESIEYNHLNLPHHIVKSAATGASIDYLYTANGVKLTEIIKKNNAIVKRIEYIGNYVYINGNIEYIQTLEGRMVPNSQSFDYEYFIKDNLGNTRIMFDENGSVIQDISYYAFGMKMDGLSYVLSTNNQVNNYLYNGKELQTDFDMDWYDYGFRMYDATIGRWHVPDPFSILYPDVSPYQYVHNNPINRVDIMGLYDEDDDIDDWRDKYELSRAQNRDPYGWDDLMDDLGGFFNEVGEFFDNAFEEMSDWEIEHYGEESDMEDSLEDSHERGELDYQEGLGDQNGRDDYGNTFLERFKNIPRYYSDKADARSNNPNLVQVEFSGLQTWFVPGGGQIKSIRTILKSWKNVNWKSIATAIKIHYKKHVLNNGIEKTLLQYTEDALNFFKTNKHLGRDIILKDGSTGTKIRTGKGVPGGIYTKDGKIVSFWYY